MMTTGMYIYVKPCCWIVHEQLSTLLGMSVIKQVQKDHDTRAISTGADSWALKLGPAGCRLSQHQTDADPCSNAGTCPEGG